MVFDLTKQMSDVIVDPEFPEEFVDKNIQQYAEYWINSIHTYVGSDDGSEPPIILVGTHKDKLEGDEHMKEQYKDKYFENIRKLFEGTSAIKHIHSKDFAIDCTNPHDRSIAELREEIVRLGSKERVVPARWLHLEKALIDIKHKRVIPFSDVVDIDSRSNLPLKDKDNIRLFLQHHHNKGNLFYFDEVPISSYVVVDTQYLINAFRCIVTSERFCKKEPAYRDLWRILRQEARLEMKLIEKVWNDENGFLKHKKELLMFLQKHYIISEAKSYDEETESTQGLGWFIVPCFLRDKSSNDALEVFLNGRQQTQVRFAMSFHISPVVQIVYYRLIAALIGKWSVLQIPGQQKRVLLYENLGVFRLDRHHVGIVEHHQNIIDLRALSLCQSSGIKGSVVDKFRRFVVSVVSSEFRKLRYTVTNQEQPFEICFKCNHESHCLDGSKGTVLLDQLKENKVEPCPDFISGHEINTREVLLEWFQDYQNIGLRSDCQFEQRQLSKLSQTIGRNWELLGIELGLTNIQVEHIQQDYETTEMRIFKMLLKWVAVKEEGATVNELIRAMKATKDISVDWDEVRNIVEDIACTQLAVI